MNDYLLVELFIEDTGFALKQFIFEMVGSVGERRMGITGLFALDMECKK